MAHAIQITVDAADPRAQGTFWCEVLAYIEQPPPPGFAGWEEALDDVVKIPNSKAHPQVAEGGTVKIGWSTEDCRALDPTD